MADDPLPATLGFLTDAAHLLISASPETSAHLISKRNMLMFDNDVNQSDVQRQHGCGCCGHIMIAGRGDMLKMESDMASHKKKRSSGGKKKVKVPSKMSPSPSRSGCRKILTCSKCGRHTTIRIPPPASLPKRHFKQPSKSSTNTGMTAPTGTVSSKSSGVPAGAMVSSSESAKPSANASSKKRAKNRKQGLQALLQQSSGSRPQGGLGLSLADFMQK
ncbi:hypothetical protein GGR50DRAFT_690819 [Xylaria sp. CBS 124048]|nr:hypothetical protein GGR50DRAFT_690819 [Xylaria sp. CBS 124048]